MPTYEENRKKINQRLYEINTTMDRKEAYAATVDYIIKISTQSFAAGAEIGSRYGWDEWDDDELQSYLISYGLKKVNSGK